MTVRPAVADLAFAQETLAAQPFSRLLGARIVEWQDGEAVLEIPVREELGQHMGFVAGGVLAYAADNALTFAAGSVLGGAVVTAGFSIEYLRPATGVLVRAAAQVVRAGRTRVVCRCDVFAVAESGETTLCAVAQGSASALPSP